MPWKGSPTSKEQDGLGINPAPNPKQETSNLSDIRSPDVQSEDTGLIISGRRVPLLDDDTNPIPLVGGYKKEFAIRRDQDSTENFSVSLLQIDTTIIKHLSERVGLTVMDNGALIKVPVLYASPERWNAVRRDGYLRDNQGKILLPAILIKRTNVSNNKDLMTFNRYLSYQVVMKFDQKNKYDKFDILNCRNPFKNKPTKQIFKVTLPDHVIVTYECILWTDYVDQNNALLEKINFATHDYWGVDSFRFRTRVDDYTHTVELTNGEDRNVKTTFSLIVNAYLLPETTDEVKATTFKTFTVRKIVVSDRVIGERDMGVVKNNAIASSSPYGYLKDIGVEYINNNRSLPASINPAPAPIVERSMFHPAPVSTTSYGENGWLAYDESYIYVYRSPYGWLRRPIPEFDFDSNAGAYISGYDCDDLPIYTTGTRPINTAFRIFQRFSDKFYYQVPYQSTDYGEDGWISYDGSYFYIYSSNAWHRVPIAIIGETF